MAGGLAVYAERIGGGLAVNAGLVGELLPEAAAYGCGFVSIVSLRIGALWYPPRSLIWYALPMLMPESWRWPCGLWVGASANGRMGAARRGSGT